MGGRRAPRRRTQSREAARLLGQRPADRPGTRVWPWAPGSSRCCRSRCPRTRSCPTAGASPSCVSIVLVIVGFVVRLKAEETPAFEKVRDRRRSARRVPSRTSSVAAGRWGDPPRPALAVGRGRRVQHLGRLRHHLRHRHAAAGEDSGALAVTVAATADGRAAAGVRPAGRPLRPQEGLPRSASRPTRSRSSRRSPVRHRRHRHPCSRSRWCSCSASSTPGSTARRARCTRSLYPAADPLHRPVDGVPAVRDLRVGPDAADPHRADRRRGRNTLAGLRIPGRPRRSSASSRRCC